MIKTDIVAYVSSYALEGELIVPSAVLTSTPQEEEINLAYTPNFQLKLMDKNSYVVDDAWMSFSYSDTNYTAYMNVVNRTQDGIVTLQYNNGLVVEKTPQPEPEPSGLDVIMVSGNEVEWQSPDIIDLIEVTDPNQDDPVTGEPPLIVTGDCTFSCGDSNIAINGAEITASAPGVYEIIAQDNNTGRIGSVIWTITEGQPEPEPVDPLNPLNSMLTIAGPLTQDPKDSYYSIVYSYETQDVYMRSKGMTYDSDNNRYEFVPDAESNMVAFFAPTTHVFETITFVDLDSTYKSALLQMGELGYGVSGVLTEDGNDLIWTRTTDYDPTDVEGCIYFEFNQIIKQVGAPMSFEEIHITLTPV